MSNTITLASIREATEKKFGSTIIALDENNTVELLNPLRLNKAKRKEIGTISDRLKEDDADQETILSDMLKSVAKTPAQGKALIAAINGDFAMLLSTFEAYTSEQSVGEASPSES